MNTTAAATLVLTATTDPIAGGLGGAHLVARFDTIDEARAFAATFPGSAKFRAVPVGDRAGVVDYAIVDASFNLAANGTTGERNETAEKRYRSVVARAARLGITIDYRAPYGNSYPTREAFEANLAS